MGEYNTAIVLCAGSGKRMHSDTPKQFMDLCGKPVAAWSLEAFQKFDGVQEIVVVTGESDIDFVRSRIGGLYGFSKVSRVVAGGSERCLSVRNGLRAADPHTDYVFIHDGARPMLDQGILSRTLEAVRKCRAVAAGMPSKDTMKITDAEGYVVTTPDRRHLWAVQTPQVFSYPLVRDAYEQLTDEDVAAVTDDAMVVECKTKTRVRLVEGTYRNIKITTPEDLLTAELYIKTASV